MKKILVITEKLDMDHDIHGFFHGHILDIERSCDQLTIICLEKGNHNLPGSVNVLSLGKEAKQSRLQYLKNFYSYILKERNNYDVVLVNLIPEYVVLGGIFWRLMNKKIIFWYNHTYVNTMLRLAVLFSHAVYTPSKDMCRINSKKIHVTEYTTNVPEHLCE